jgi:hypothetical protein
MGFETPVDLASCCKSRRPYNIHPSPASQVEALDVKNSLEQSRFSNSKSGESSIVYSFLVRAHNLQILIIGQGSMPRIDGSFLLRFSLLLSQTWSVVHWTFLILLPITADYLGRWAPSSSVSRPYDAMESLYPRFPQPYSRRRDRVSWPCWAPCCLHPIPDWVNWPLQPRSGYKMEPFNRNRRYESSFSIQVRQYHYSCSSSTYFNPLEQVVLPCRPRRREEVQSRLKVEINPSCHPWLRLRKSSNCFAGHC